MGRLANGLRTVHLHCHSKVAYCGVTVGAGSRDDPDDRHGLAHFVEHTIFKGTLRRRSWRIISRMERVGGEISAYTTKEETVVYSVFPCAYFDRAAELISDIVINSQFPENELAKERDVVLEEVNSYLDTPSEAVYDDFEEMVWRGSALGHNILGNEAHLLATTSADCRKHLENLFAPGNMVFFALGPMCPDAVTRLAEKYFGQLDRPLVREARVKPAVLPPFHATRDIGSHQAHTIYGVPIFGVHDSRKYALSLLNNILGGPGMSSLLNVAIRERRGYVYTIESSLLLLSDCGLFTVYFGSDCCHVRPSLRIMGNIIDRLASKPMTQRTLDAAKRQFIGQWRINDDNHENRALAAAKSVLHFGRIDPDEAVVARISDVTPAQVMDAAESIEAQVASTLTLL